MVEVHINALGFDISFIYRCFTVQKFGIDAQAPGFIFAETAAQIQIFTEGTFTGKSLPVTKQRLFSGFFGNQVYDAAGCWGFILDAAAADAGIWPCGDIDPFKGCHRHVELRQHSMDTIDVHAGSVGPEAADREIIMQNAACLSDCRNTN